MYSTAPIRAHLPLAPPTPLAARSELRTLLTQRVRAAAVQDGGVAGGARSVWRGSGKPPPFPAQLHAAQLPAQRFPRGKSGAHRRRAQRLANRCCGLHRFTSSSDKTGIAIHPYLAIKAPLSQLHAIKKGTVFVSRPFLQNYLSQIYLFAIPIRVPRICRSNYPHNGPTSGRIAKQKSR